MEISALIVAAGTGNRMNVSINKQFLILNDMPILSHTLHTFDQCTSIDNIILVIKREDRSFIEKNVLPPLLIKTPVQLIEGGKTRTDSVENGLQAIQHKGIVLIHDGARPFVTFQEIERVIQGVHHSGAAVLGVPTKNTVKIVDSDSQIITTPDRRQLYMIQTPQGFKVPLIKEVYAKRNTSTRIFWDDAMLVEQLSKQKVTLVAGSYENIKITTPIDLILGKEILRQRASSLTP